MKKTLFLLAFSSLLFMSLESCKSKTETPPAVETTEVVPPAVAEPAVASEIVSSIAIPTFENVEVTKFCESYKGLMTEYASLKGTGDKEKASVLNKKFTDWANEAAKLAGKIKPEEMQKFNDFILSAQKKFEEMNSAIAK